MWAGLWQKRCKFPETSTAIAYEQHGFFEQVDVYPDLQPSTFSCRICKHESLFSSHQAQESYERAMEKARKEHERTNTSPAIFPEYQLWEDHWIR